MDNIVSLCKRRGFIFANSDIYGGLSNTWDYGPFGVEFKNNVKRAWWKANVHCRDDIYGMDAAILMHPNVWDASGHIKQFHDYKSDCKTCHKLFKIADLNPVRKKSPKGKGLSNGVKDKNICPDCGGKLTEARPFNLMFKTYQGVVEDKASLLYLRPETAQGMFVNFLNVLDSCHPKLPFGLAQIGKAFRNEVTPGNFTFRTREFEQMEIEYFVHPDHADKKLEEWIEDRFNWYINLGIRKENLRKRLHGQDELAHYAAACTDIEYKFPFGWQELEGIANRTDFDLKQHGESSGKDFRYFDTESKERFYPYIIEPSGGVDRTTLAFLVDAYREEEVKKRKRVFLSLHKDLAPIKVAVLPLLTNRAEIVELARNICQDLKKKYFCVYDDTAAIGKLYRRQDEVGTPYCVTVDVESLEDRKVTVRDRDTMNQDRIGIDKLKDYLKQRLAG
ncbi:MAG: glycine--tRNA ligase [Candidatus Omnitrophica bacterium]|nr:glycine--tRNA ligase [Candidatus Omnitrophota bacterium]